MTVHVRENTTLHAMWRCSMQQNVSPGSLIGLHFTKPPGCPDTLFMMTAWEKSTEGAPQSWSQALSPRSLCDVDLFQSVWQCERLT